MDRHGVLIDGSSTYYEANATCIKESLPANIAKLLTPREVIILLVYMGSGRYLGKGAP